MRYTEFIDKVSQSAGIEHHQAERASHTFFEMLSQRIGPDEAKHLASQLPNEFAVTINHAAHDQRKPSTEEFFEYIGDHVGRGQAHRYDHSRAIWRALKQAVSRGQIADLRANLPNELVGVLE